MVDVALQLSAAEEYDQHWRNLYPSWPEIPPLVVGERGDAVPVAGGQLQSLPPAPAAVCLRFVGEPGRYSYADMASIKSLHTDCFPVTYGSDFYDQIATGGIFSVCARRRDVGVNVLENPDSVSKPESPSCSCEGGEEVVGLLCLRHELGERTDVPVEITGSPRFLYIATLGVARHARGCGIAKALVRHVLQIFGADARRSDCLGRSAASRTTAGTTAVPAAGDLVAARKLLGLDWRRDDPSTMVVDEEQVERESITIAPHKHYEETARGRGGRTAEVNHTPPPASPFRPASWKPNGPQHGVVGIYLHVIAFNKHAQRLYEGLGFAYYSTRCGFYELNGKSYDAYTYVYMFDKHLQNRLQKTNCAAAAGD